MTALALAAACVIDGALGDPVGWPHPVRLIGGVCTLCERLACCYARSNEVRELFAGSVLCATIVGGTYCAARITLMLAYRLHRRCGLVLEIALAWTTLAARNLLDEALAVIVLLEREELAQARVRVARIVGRDTKHLDAPDIARAAIETLAESACDGIVAPLCALAIGGVPLALAFKAASTLDSMIGHIEPPYTFLGRASARLDDLACYVPARFTALLIAGCAPLVSGDRRRALSVLRADGRRHRSPNAGLPEAAMAGALGVRLGGPNRYDGIVHDAPYLGARFTPPTVEAARRAAALIGTCAFVATATLVALLAAVERLRESPS